MPILIILLIVAFAVFMAKRSPDPDSKRVDDIEERVNEVGEQVADFMLDGK